MTDEQLPPISDEDRAAWSALPFAILEAEKEWRETFNRVVSKSPREEPFIVVDEAERKWYNLQRELAGIAPEAMRRLLVENERLRAQVEQLTQERNKLQYTIGQVVERMIESAVIRAGLPDAMRRMEETPDAPATQTTNAAGT